MQRHCSERYRHGSRNIPNHKHAMITKVSFPLFNDKDRRFIDGIRTEYRLFGLLIYTKIRYTPYHYGVSEWIGYNDLTA